MATAAATTTLAPPEARRSCAQAPWWVWLLGLSLGAVHLLPHLGARLVESPPARVYVGFVHMIPDHVSYLGFAEQVRIAPRWPLSNPYTTEDQDGRFPMAYFALVGVLSHLVGVDVLHVWYALTPLCSMLMALAVWRLCGLFLTGASWQRLGFLITCLGGGLGWVAVLIRPPLGSLEALAFGWNWSVFAAAMLPMWTLAHALLALAIGSLLEQAAPGARSRPHWVRCAGVSLALFATHLVHPYTGLAGLAIATGVALGQAPALERAQRRRYLLWSALQVAGGTVLIGALSLWARGDPVYRATSDNVLGWIERLSPLWYPLMYGVPLLLAVVGALRAHAHPGAQRTLVLVAWCAVTLLLSNLWFWPGVKFQYLVYLPLGLLATQGAQVLVARWPRLVQGRRRATTAVVAALAIGGGPFPDALREIVPRPDAPIFVSQPQLDLLAALRTLPAGGVIAPPSVAILVPWRAAKPVYDGHWFLSPRHDERLAEVRRLYHPAVPEEWKLQFIERARVRYLIEDPWSTGRFGQRLGPLALVERYRNPFGRVLELVPLGPQAGGAP